MSQEYTVYKKFTAQDYATIPFNANKQYTFDSSASAASNKVNYFNARYTSESIDTYSSNSIANQNIKDTINTIQYNQLDHLYYKNYKRNLGNVFGEWHYVNQKRELYKDVNIISMPVGHYGHSIKKGSFEVTDTVNGATLVDDSKGNLILKNTNISDYNISIEDNLFKLGPIKGFKKYDLSIHDGYIKINPYETIPYYRRGTKKAIIPTSYSTPDLGDEFDDSYYFNLIKYKNVNFSEKTLFNDSLFPGIDFNGINSEIKKANDEKFDFNKDSEFTISFWASVSTQSADFKNYIISKSTTKTIIPSPSTGRTGLPRRLSSSNASQPIDVNAGPIFPFEIYVENGTNSTSPHVFFSRQDKDASKTISASFTTGSTLQHVTCTRSKTGNMEIFINGIGSGISGSDGLNITQNNANIYIGNKGGKSNFLLGSLSNINIYSKALTDAQILNHYSSSNSSPYVGNVFYSHGIAAITHPDYKNFLSGSSVVNEIKYQGNHLIYENEYQCTIDEYEFNDTLNISARKNRTNQSADLEDFATGSLFKPYITTVGLYNENKELLVVGKLGQPLRTSNETDTTIILRWDT
jgi:hypothetical protein